MHTTKRVRLDVCGSGKKENIICVKNVKPERQTQKINNHIGRWCEKTQELKEKRCMRNTVNLSLLKVLNLSGRALIPSKSKKKQRKKTSFSLLFVYSVLAFLLTLP